MKKLFTLFLLCLTLSSIKLNAQKEEFLLEECYNFHQEVLWQSKYMWNLLVASDFVLKGGADPSDQTAFTEIDNYEIRPDSEGPRQIWKVYYNGIEKCNELIIYLNETSDDPTIRAQAKFIRAYNYFHLTQLFGGVPIITDDCTTQLGKIGRSTQEEVFNFIIQEMDDAIPDLPYKSQLSYDQEYTATKGAAKSVKGMALVYLKDWVSASTVFEDIINQGEYSLLSNFEDLWLIENEHNAESIYEFEYSKNEDYNWGNAIWSGKSKDNRLIQLFGPNISEVSITDNAYHNGWGFGSISQDLLDLYDAHGDIVRKSATILDFASIGTPGGTGHQYTGYKGKKYTTRKSHTSMNNGGVAELNYGQNIVKIRYADIILLYAETQAHLGNEATALTHLNYVRQRAGVATLNVSGQELLDAIFEERTLEFALEGKRFLDIIRWGKGAELLGNLGFEDHEGLWPIPENVLIENSLITQNPGYGDASGNYRPTYYSNPYNPKPTYPWKKVPEVQPEIEKIDVYKYNFCMDDSLIKYRAVYSYNEKGLMSEYLLSWNNNDDLTESYKESYTYNSEDKLILSAKMKKDNLEWDTIFANFYIYKDNSLFVDSFARYYQNSAGIYQPTAFYIENYYWDEDQDSCLFETASWYLRNSGWELSDFKERQKYLYQYNNDNKIIEIIKQFWNEGNAVPWMNSTQEVISYNDGILDKKQKYRYTENGTELISEIEYAYNSNNQIISCFESDVNGEIYKKTKGYMNDYSNTSYEIVKTPLKYQTLHQNLKHFKEKEFTDLKEATSSKKVLDEGLGKAVLFYPNPSDGITRLQGIDKFPIKVSIYELSGKLKMEKKVNQNEINLSVLNNGTYLISINGGKDVSKLIIQK